jgi:uncharacterized protein
MRFSHVLRMIVLQPEPKTENKPNRLINEKSPYLLQHAYNPVNWYPWGKEALDKAKVEDRPIFLSIGYSTCHWCHVMEKECFEDGEVAKLLNDAFVCIKVDREERPDLDATYMQVCQSMGRSCGWPLNVLLTPRLNPFFAASYIPKTSDRGMTGMIDLVPQVMQIWKLQRNQLEMVGADIRSRVESLQKWTPEEELDKKDLDDAYEKFVMDFDDENGGFGSAPKFPVPHNLLFLLRYWKRTGEKNALVMVEKTLRQMRLGGIFDQVGFGFHRYSTDAVWLVPHFEKMLYDQALLALAYTEAHQATGAAKFKLTAQETLQYVMRDLATQEGAFMSAEDADSEGEEGKYYLWTLQELQTALQPGDVDLAVKLFDVRAEGNYFDAAMGGKNGKNILHLPKPVDQLAQELGLTVDALIVGLGRVQAALYAARKKRVPPSKDDKVLVDWNGLAIAALAKASQAFRDQRYLEAALKAADFILKHMRSEDGTLFHRYVKGERAVEGFLDDYAFLTWGLLEIYEANFQIQYLQAAQQLTKTIIGKFWDEKDGGFFFNATRDNAALPRIKQVYDGALPSGNSVAMLNLQRLGALTNESGHKEIVGKMSRAFSEEVKGAPWAHAFMLCAVDFAVGPICNVILIGALNEPGVEEMLAALRKSYLPNVVVSIQPPSPLIGVGYEKLEGKATAYVCRDQMCLPPTNQISKMLQLLENDKSLQA